MSSEEIWLKYTKEKIISIGKFSLIYKAKDIKGNNIVVKEINKEKFKEITNLNFNDEEILNKLKLENNDSLIEIINTENYFYIISDFYLCNLEKYLKVRKDNLSIEEIRKILIELNKDLKRISEKNIIFTDLKPENILINLEKINKITIKLSNYDSSKFINNNQISKLNVDLNTLTVAPEIINSNKSYSKSDIWSLGIIIYYMLFKEYPFNINEIKKGAFDKNKMKLIEDNILNDLIEKMLKINLNERLDWNGYFNHSFFNENNNNENETFNLPYFNFECFLHKEKFEYYCYNCKNNICEICLNKHENHNIIPFYQIGLSEEEKNQFDNLVIELENNLLKFNKMNNSIISIINQMKLIKENTLIYENDNINNYKKYYLNYLKRNKIKLESEEKINLIDLSVKLQNNYITGIYEIKKEDVNIPLKILNSFDEVQKEIPEFEGIKNEKELKESLELYINEKKIKFTYVYSFEKEGENYIKIKSKKHLTNICSLFCGSHYIKKIDFSNFNTLYVNNMRALFGGCHILIDLNFTNFNTSNVTNMEAMFMNCLSLKNLDLSNFNTINVTNMYRMFSNCTSLEKLNLSSFNTINVNNMIEIFFGLNKKCNLITKDKNLLREFYNYMNI